MLETISAIASVLVTVTGSLKGLVDLYQVIKSILPTPTTKTASQLLTDKDKKNYESVYESLTISREYVAEVLKRIRTQYITTAVTIVVTWAAVLTALLIGLRLLRGLNLIAVSTFMIIGGILIAIYLMSGPSQLSEIKNIKKKLQDQYYVLLGGQAKQLENILSSAMDNLSSVWMGAKPLKDAFPKFLSARPLSRAERDLIESHIQLLSLVASMESYLLKTKLLEAKASIQESSQKEFLSILSEALTGLVRDETLTKPDDGEHLKKWRERQEKVIREEFTKLGLQDWLQLIPNNTQFYEQDFTDLSRDQNKLRDFLKQNLNLTSKDKPKSNFWS